VPSPTSRCQAPNRDELRKLRRALLGRFRPQYFLTRTGVT
jgi:hypothetical protein